MKNKLLLGFALSTMCTQPGYGKNRLFIDFDEMFSSMREEMDKTFKNLEETLKDVPGVSISSQAITSPEISENDKCVIIEMKVNAVDAEKIQAKVIKKKNENHLLITVPQDNQSIEMIIGERNMQFSTKQETKEKDEKKAAFYTFGTTNIVKSLPSAVVFDDVKIECERIETEKDKSAESMLSITLHKLEPTETEIIPVIKK
ncbi:MAG: hypothetical protein WDZ41_02780 [Candidatus Babeliales bacterium]